MIGLSPLACAALLLALTSAGGVRAEPPPPPDPPPLALSRLVPVDVASVYAPTGDVPGCEDELREAGVTFRPSQIPVHGPVDRECGAPQVVTYVSGPRHIAYEPRPVLTCAMALALASFEPLVQEENAPPSGHLGMRRGARALKAPLAQPRSRCLRSLRP